MGPDWNISPNAIVSYFILCAYSDEKQYSLQWVFTQTIPINQLIYEFFLVRGYGYATCNK